MYGNLLEIDLSSLLKFISNQQKSGSLLIEEKNDNSDNLITYYYIIFFDLGKIIYVADAHSFNSHRLLEYLSYYNLSSEIKSLQKDIKSNKSLVEYELVILLFKNKILDYQNIKKIINLIIKEVLGNIISLHQGNFTWQESSRIHPVINTFDVDNLISAILKSKQKWLENKYFIPSSYHVPKISSPYFTYELILKELKEKIDGKNSLLTISRTNHDDLGNLSALLSPAVKMGDIIMIEPIKWERNHQIVSQTVNIIALIDNIDLGINLKQNSLSTNYNLLLVNSFSRGLELIIKVKPSLIIWALKEDIINHLEFISMVKTFPHLQDIPIIIATENYQFQDNLNSKVKGAGEYILSEDLLKIFPKIINKYLFI
ncbi:MAG: DUF4388 domain-containing protein [Cyanobacterium sp. T60_A2020_053]|nr:DUF4388 domain-containing protein [Cyanobacterium sp. T60_A2020_053]